MPDQFDMVVIGGGPGGYVAALRGRRLGLSVALVEKQSIGGVCLNRGCIPTKALLADAEGIRWMHRAAKEQIIGPAPEANFSRMIQRKDSVVGNLVRDLEKHLAAAGVKIVLGCARLTGPGEIQTDSGVQIRAKNVVLATGSTSWTPPIDGANLPGVLTTDQILQLDKAPHRLVIIGGGAIGQEFAAIFSAVGAQATILEALDRILPGVDSELARKYLNLLPPKKVAVELGVTALRIEKAGDSLRVVYERKSVEKAVDADIVLVAAGRRPWFGGVGIEELGIDLADGAVAVDSHLRTSISNMYAVGDVLGRRMLAHEAWFHGEVAAENIAGRERTAEDYLVPCCIYTFPQIAWVGLTQEDAERSGRPHRTSTFPLSSNGKALAMGEARGWVKLIEDSEKGRLVGAHIMGPSASELVGEMTLAIRLGMSARDVADSIHPHPTISEALREAALGFLDGPLHAAARIAAIPAQTRGK
jgi:dihydrolipoamide dehydrogenase